MIEYNIFIAGSTESSVIEDTKKEILVLANTIKNTTDCQLRCSDCSDPSKDNKQEKFNNYIKEQADLFILLIDKVPVGPYSMEELLRACVHYEKDKHPEVYVFFSASIDKDPYVYDLRNVIKTFTNRYSQPFSDTRELREQLDKIIRSNIESKKKHKIEEEKAKKNQNEANIHR